MKPRPKLTQSRKASSDDTSDGSTLDASEDIASRPCRSLCSRCFGMIKYFMLFILLPPFLNFAALHQERKSLLPQKGAEYDIGLGQKLFFSCQGSGTPTVLLDAPTGLNSDVWELVVDKVSKTTRVCSYDRAGIGFSDRPYQNETTFEEETSNGKSHNRWHAYTVERMADDLYGLLTYRTQQLEKPFIYVGAELGAMVARFYSNIYETDVSDVVLVEPLVETLFSYEDGLWAHHWYSHVLPAYQTMQLGAALGVTRLALMTGLVDTPLSRHEHALSQDVHLRQKYLLCLPRHLSSAVDEHYFMNESFSQMQTLFMMKKFPDNISVTVINGNYYDEQLPSPLNKAWAKAQQHLLSKLHGQAQHIVVNGADRKMLYRSPDTIVQQIKKIVKNRRTKAKNIRNFEKS